VSDFSLHPKWVSLPNVLLDKSGELIPAGEPVPVGDLFPSGSPIRCEIKGRDAGASLGRTNIWIRSDVADQFDAIQ
jgi:hypothetical protein